MWIGKLIHTEFLEFKMAPLLKIVSFLAEHFEDA